MYRTLIFILAAGLVAMVAGCGGDGNDTAQNTAQKTETAVTHTADKAPESQSRTMIPDALEAVEGMALGVYFDEAGTVSEKAVAAGELITFYVTAEFKEPFHVNAAQYRVEVPDGIQVVGETKHSDRVLTVGSWESDFSIAFECRPPGKFYLVKYSCTVGPEFAGGVIKVTPGVNPHGISYLGFVSCKPTTEKLPAKGGSATLAKK